MARKHFEPTQAKWVQKCPSVSGPDRKLWLFASYKNADYYGLGVWPTGRALTFRSLAPQWKDRIFIPGSPGNLWNLVAQKAPVSAPLTEPPEKCHQNRKISLCYVSHLVHIILQWFCSQKEPWRLFQHNPFIIRCPLTYNGLNPFKLTQTQTNMLSNTAALLLSSEWPTLGQNLTQSLFYNKVWIISWYLLIIVLNMTNRKANQILFQTSVELKTHTRDHLSLKRSHGKVNTLLQHTQSWQKGRRTICLHLVLFCFCQWLWTGQSASIKPWLILLHPWDYLLYTFLYYLSTL